MAKNKLPEYNDPQINQNPGYTSDCLFWAIAILFLLFIIFAPLIVSLLGIHILHN